MLELHTTIEVSTLGLEQVLSKTHREEKQRNIEIERRRERERNKVSLHK